ncbi:MAG: pantetheine-phosphate adenylyltransferase, partial [Lachnospiraceae bacterium]|nr:pantetheine-phosphate adenylyltransferase [Lachnospiraceae bacterium]
LRAVTDFEYELQLSQINQKLCPEVDTVFFTTNLKYAYLSSSIVKEVARYNGDISEFVPEFVAKRIHDKMKSEE